MLRLLGWLLVLGVTSAAAVWWLGRGSRLRRREAGEARAAAHAFARQRDELTDRTLAAARQTGKPRGLAWEEVCLMDGEPLLAADAATGDLYALAAVEVSFSAVEEGGMEEVEAVGDVRAATAVLVWRDGQWRSDGRVVFNHTPDEALARYATSLRPVAID